MANIIEFIVEGIGECFYKLASFEFLGTNMLKFTLTLLILGNLIPIIFTLTKGMRLGETDKLYRPKHEMKNREPVKGRRSDRYK